LCLQLSYTNLKPLALFFKLILNHSDPAIAWPIEENALMKMSLQEAAHSGHLRRVSSKSDKRSSANISASRSFARKPINSSAVSRVSVDCRFNKSRSRSRLAFNTANCTHNISPGQSECTAGVSGQRKPQEQA
jgi:hypothetical protein